MARIRKPLTETGRVQAELNPSNPDDYARLEFLESLRRQGKFVDHLRKIIDLAMAEDCHDGERKPLHYINQRLGTIEAATGRVELCVGGISQRIESLETLYQLRQQLQTEESRQKPQEAGVSIGGAFVSLSDIERFGA